MTHPNIPVEIYLEILSYLYHDCPAICGEIAQHSNELLASCGDAKAQRVALWALCLTSRWFNQLATPFLYRSITPDIVSIPYLLRTLQERPELGEFTKSIGLYATGNFLNIDARLRIENLKGREEHYKYLRTCYSPVIASIEDLAEGEIVARKAAHAFGFSKATVGWTSPAGSYKEGMDEEFRDRDLEKEPWFWACTLLYFLPHLQVLDVILDALNGNSGIFNDFVQKSFDSEQFLVAVPRAFYSLRIVSCRHLGLTRQYNHSEFFPHTIMRAPRLTKFSIQSHRLAVTTSNIQNAIGRDQYTGQRLSVLDFPFVRGIYHGLQSTVSRIERLGLHHCTLDYCALYTLLHLSPNLRFLTVNMVEPLELTNFDEAGDRYIANALLLVKGTLEELAFSFDDICGFLNDSPNAYLEHPELWWVGDLRSFPKLRKVELDKNFWCLPPDRHGPSSAYLPQRLEKLRIDTNVEPVGPAGWTNPRCRFIRPIKKVLYDGTYHKTIDGGRLPELRWNRSDY
ncbi:hypothetical protein BJ508DRAFT_9012 [Ascobolus immersus RN42]|uniref:F-box domain-containing protein n=1 Tax=Ascobolus immersus RN42 TaxID=1160509 RepID=A0A3N4HTM9_ASCIM|nr:hypothetical protein BJ508DRAFT_9012 [Ascobolus immersus RN42]